MNFGIPKIQFAQPRYAVNAATHASRRIRSRLLLYFFAEDVAFEIPSVVLQPEGHFEQRFLLEDVYSFDQAGDYEITFATVISVLVGEKNGQYARMCPIRVPVAAGAKFVLSISE